MNNDNNDEIIESLDEPVSTPTAAPDFSGMIGSDIKLKSSVTDPTINFDKHADIGLLPPNRDDNKGSIVKKIIFTIVVLLAMGFVGFGVYYYLSMANSRAKEKVKPKDLTYDVGVELSMNPKDYATFKGVSPTNCYVDLSNVNVKKAGKYEYSVVCGNETYKGSITINDGSAPKVTTKDVTVPVGSTVAAKDFISKCEDDTECSYKFVDESKVKDNLKTAGEYEIEIEVSDASNNSVVVNAKLKVIESTPEAYLNCTGAIEFSEDNSSTIYIVDIFALDKSGKYLGIATREHHFMYFDTNKYNEDKQSASSSKFKEYEGKVSFDDAKYEVLVESSFSDSELTSTEKIKEKYTANGYTCIKK